MENKKLDEIIVADLDQVDVLEEPEAVTRSRKEIEKKEKEDSEMTKKLKLREGVEDSFDVKFFEDLGFSPLDEKTMSKQTDRYDFKLDYSKLPIVSLSFTAQDVSGDSPENVLEFDDLDECKMFVKNDILGAGASPAGGDNNLDSVGDNRDVTEDIDDEDLENIIKKSIKSKSPMNEGLEEANIEASDIESEADLKINELQNEIEDIRKGTELKTREIFDRANAEKAAKDAELKEKAQSDLITSTLKNLIQDEWNAIEQYQSAISIIAANTKNEALLAVLNDIVAEEMVHVGQLNKAMKYNLPGFEQLAKEGEDEAASQLGDSLDDIDDIEDEIESALDDMEDDTGTLDDGEPLPIENPDEIEELEQDIKPAIPSEKAKEAHNILDDGEPLPVDADEGDLV